MKKKELTAADVWAMFAEAKARTQEIERVLNEKFAESNRRMQETERILKESSRETDKKLEKLGIKVGGMDDNIGHHAEQYFQDILAETLTFGGIKYDEMIPNI
ncbi:MAG: hypothetical protein LBH25_00710, partial [Fibromonadaceae bacterium]|nr:hypothetical protein [Fibromonadaceae bacterium]